MNGNRKRKQGRGLLMTAGSVWAAWTALASHAQAADAGGAPQGQPPAAQVQAGVTAGMTANLFRLHAAVNVDSAVEKWGNDDVKRKWRADVLPLFEDASRFELHDFFSGAVVWVGGVKGTHAVVAFYSPWVDGALVAALDGADEHKPVLTDFAFVSGETLRGADVPEPEEALALYALKEPLMVAVARSYAPSSAAFAALYPPQGDPVLVPPALKARLDSPQGELALLKARMLARLRMFKAYLDPANRGWLVQSGVLMHALKSGTREQLLAALSEKQPAALVETFCQLDPRVRSEYAPLYFAKAAEGVVVGFANPSAPRWLVEATFQGAAPAPRAARIELMDLDLSGKVLALWGKEAAK